MATWMDDLVGLNNVRINNASYISDGNQDPTRVLSAMDVRHNQGFSEAMFINAKMLRRSDPGDGSLMPNHWVVYAGGLSMSTNNGIISYSFDVFTWGDKRNVTVTSDEFQSNFYGSVSGN